MNAPIVSVIIPARNERRLIVSTLNQVFRAARNMGNHDVEVLVVDNASTDGTWEILQRYAKHHPIQTHKLSQLGAARARNFGRKHASGRILVFLDADTQVPTHAFSRIIEHCELRGIEAGITRLVGLEGGLRSAVWWWFWEHVRRLPLSHAKAMPAFMFCTASVFDEFGPFDEEVAIGEEWPILASLFRNRRHCFVYDRSLSIATSDRRMQQQVLGYSRTFLKYVWAILHQSGRRNYTDRIR
jgi:glycosyltransferase involved in cell wall biosynthesis